MWHGIDGMGWGWIGLGIVHMVVFWGVVVVLLVALVRWLVCAPSTSSRRATPGASSRASNSSG